MTTDVGNLIREFRERRDALDLFDASCWLGRPWETTFWQVADMDELVAGLHRFGIRRAIVAHTMCLQHDPDVGNRTLLAALSGRLGLVAAATLVPEMAATGGWNDCLRSLIRQGVRMARVFPAAHNFCLDDVCVGDMLAAAEQLRLPLMVWQTQTNWNAVSAVCERHSQLRLIVEGCGRKLFYDNRIYYSLLRRHANLMLETHNLVNYLGLDDLVQQFGSTRFVFGSQFPHLDPSSAAALVTLGRMLPADRRTIACGNLERLLAEVEQP